jgi:hypothetical protein
MKLVIPRLKADKISLIKPWAFNLHHERRNSPLLDHLSIAYIDSKYVAGEWLYPAPEVVSLAKGTVLSIERYYIRQGNEQFDSVTFMIHEINGVALKKKIRFWVKLDEACLAEFKYV